MVREGTFLPTIFKKMSFLSLMMNARDDGSWPAAWLLLGSCFGRTFKRPAPRLGQVLIHHGKSRLLLTGILTPCPGLGLPSQVPSLGLSEARVCSAAVPLPRSYYFSSRNFSLLPICREWFLLSHKNHLFVLHSDTMFSN